MKPIHQRKQRREGGAKEEERNGDEVDFNLWDCIDGVVGNVERRGNMGSKHLLPEPARSLPEVP